MLPVVGRAFERVVGRGEGAFAVVARSLTGEHIVRAVEVLVLTVALFTSVRQVGMLSFIFLQVSLGQQRLVGARNVGTGVLDVGGELVLRAGDAVPDENTGERQGSEGSSPDA